MERYTRITVRAGRMGGAPCTRVSIPPTSFHRDGYLELQPSEDRRVYVFVSGSDEPQVERAARTLVRTLGLTSDDLDEPAGPTR